MAIIVKFDVTGMDASTYDQIIRQLEDTGQGAPDGRRFHVCYGDRQRLQVIDVFERPEKLDDFGQKLMPILQEHSVEAKPEVVEVYNIIEG